MNKDLLKISNISDGTATILLYKHFGDMEDMGMGINGAWIAEDIQYLNEYGIDQIQKINVRINSVGGSVQEGYSICAAILNSKIPVDTYIDGMAYSMAGVVAMCGRKKYMSDFGTFMMHNAMGSDNQEVLDLITNSLAIIFDGTTSLTMDKCKALMQSETWLSAEECMTMGIIDEVVKTNNKKMAVSNSAKELYALYNKVLTKSNKKMNNLTNLLKLSNDASEEAIVEAVSAKDAKIAELEASIESINAEISALKLEKEEAEMNAKIEVIENAISEGKIDATTKEIYVNSNKSAVELKDVFNKLKPAYTPIFDNSASAPEVTGRESWTYDDWQKKDSQGLLELSNSNPVLFAELVKTLKVK